jgi:phosphoribosylanthranilate isomerase
MTLIKICGITNLTDAHAAVAAGADALGFNFYRPSPRYILPGEARQIIEELPKSLLTVGVFVNEESPEAVRQIATEAGVGAVQLHGDESPSFSHALSDFYVIKTFAVGEDFELDQVRQYEVQAIMLDASHSKLRGGTGCRVDWDVARTVSEIEPKLFLAGGLSPENVAEAIDKVRPFAVDVCSSIEESPGRKNEERIRKFVQSVRNVKP